MSEAPSSQAPVEPAPPEPASATERLRFRLRVAAAAVLLAGLAFVQSPGLVAPDTKLDLTRDPGGFLARALHLWDQQGALGQLQNQAYGYLWPMGPLFWLGDALGLPDWSVQRLWWALVLATAFVGAALLLRALGVRRDLAVLVAAFAYALSPRMLTVLGPISIEAWPSALAPWVLLALVRGSQGGSARRHAALAALGVTMVGGVNAAATFAVIPLGAVWLLTRSHGPRRTALMLWWPLFTLLGTLWWLVPLFVMGAYSPPFLDFIESASVTTFPTTVFDALRGTSNWVPYVDAFSRSGNELLTTPYLITNSVVLVAVGLWGLSLRSTPHRTFAVLSVLVGLLMVTAGHVGAVAGWLSGDLRTLLDGVLAPLRNVHKFDPIIRLPLVIGVAFWLDQALAGLRRPADDPDADDPDADAPDADAATDSEERPRARSGPGAQHVLIATVVLAVAAAAAPALNARLAPSGAFAEVPDYWVQALDWIDEQQADQADQAAGADGAALGTATLLAPGSGFGSYLWGEPRDEPAQPALSSRWAVRNVIPLTPPGSIRMLDGIEQRFTEGDGGRGLAATLRRAGVRFVVVRNDLALGGDGVPSVLVHQAIERTRELVPVATFGPPIGGSPALASPDGVAVVEGGWRSERPTVEIFEVAEARAGSATSAPDVVVAGPEDLPDLIDQQVLDETPTVLAADLADEVDEATQAELAREGRLVLTDGLRARERQFARLRDAVSAVLTPGDRRRSGNPVRDYLIDADDRWSTTARLEGARTISASSSASDATALGGARRGELPYAAIDGSGETSWTSGGDDTGRAWWRVDLDESAPRGTVRIVGGDRAATAQLLRLEWEGGRSEDLAVGPGESVEVLVDGATDWLRVVDASPVGGQRISVAELIVPGLDVQRWLATPSLPESWPAPDAIALRADRDRRNGCATVEQQVRCAVGLDVPDEEPAGLRRVVDLPQAQAYDVRLTVRGRGGEVLDPFLQTDETVQVTGSSVGVNDPRASSTAAVDGSPATSWLADPDDPAPSLTFDFLGPRTIRGIALALDERVAARRPSALRLVWPDGEREVELDGGRATFPPIRTDRLQVIVEDAEVKFSLGDSDDGLGPRLGIGIGELLLVGVPDVPLSLDTGVRRLPCGSGPQVQVGTRRWQTSVAVVPDRLRRGYPGTARLCGPVDSVPLRAGENRISALDSLAFEVTSLELTRVGGAAASAGVEALEVAAPSPVERGWTAPADARLLAVTENANPGWSADDGDGDALQAVTVDGWQQGWLVDPGAATPAETTLRFAPDVAYRAGLAGGALGVVLLLAGLLLPARRRSTARAAATPARLPRVAVVALALAGGGLVAGAGGFAVALAVLALAAASGQRRLDALRPGTPAWGAMAAALTGVAGIAYVLRPWASAQGWAGDLAWPQYLAVAALSLAVVALLGARAAEPAPRPAGTPPPQPAPTPPA